MGSPQVVASEKAGVRRAGFLSAIGSRDGLGLPTQEGSEAALSTGGLLTGTLELHLKLAHHAVRRRLRIRHGTLPPGRPRFEVCAGETMLAFCTDAFPLPLPPGHRFPLAKYALLRSQVAEEGLVPADALRIPPPASDSDLARVHAREYLERVSAGTLSEREQRTIGFPWSPEMAERSRRSVGATISACRNALEDGVAVSLAGGTHHAFPSRGAGYCVFNDAAVAARTMQAEGRARRVVILDCDVHQGDGTASIFAGDETVFTFSIHGANNFPFRKQVSDLDVALADGTGDEEYLEALDRGLRRAIWTAGAQLAIYLAGADPFEGDRLGRLALTTAGLAERDRLVFEGSRRAGIPVAVTMAGGYGREVRDTVDIHVETVRAASKYAGS